MAAADMKNIRAQDAVMYVGLETTFGSVPAQFQQCYPIWDSVEIAPDQEDLENLELRSDLYDAQQPVRGKKHGTFKFSAYLGVPTAQLDASATVSRPWLYTLLYLALGAEWPADGTTTVATTFSAAASAVGATLASAANTTDGQVLLARVSGTYEPTRLIDEASTTATFNPALTGTPSTGAGSLLQMYNYAPARSFPPSAFTSFTLRFSQATAASSALDWELRGCMMTSVEFDLAMGQIPRVTFSGEFVDWTGPSNQSLTRTAGANAIARKFRMLDAYLVLVESATTTRAHLPFESVGIKLDLGATYIPDLGGVGGYCGVMRTGGRDFATTTLRLRPDMSGSSSTLLYDFSWWEGQSDMQCFLGVATGSSTSKRWMVFDLPTNEVIGKPKRVVEGNRLLFDVTLRSKRSNVCTNTVEGNDFCLKPFGIAFG